MWYLVEVKPFAHRSDNTIEILNECTTLFVSLILPVFTEFV